MVVPCVLDLYQHAAGCVSKFKYLLPTARVLRDAMKSRFLGIFHRVNMGACLNPLTAPFTSKTYFIATLLDPNYQLFWVDDLVEFNEDDEGAGAVILKNKLRGMSA